MKRIDLLLTTALMVAMLLPGGCKSENDEAAAAVELPGIKNLKQDGRHYIAGTPSEEGLDGLKSRGVKTIIDLRRPDELNGNEAEAASERGMAYYHLPMQSDQLSDEQEAEFLKIMSERGEEPVLMHCAGGSRAGAMYGLYLGASEQCPIDEAIRRAKAAGLRNEKLEKDVEDSLRKKKQPE